MTPTPASFARRNSLANVALFVDGPTPTQSLIGRALIAAMFTNSSRDGEYGLLCTFRQRVYPLLRRACQVGRSGRSVPTGSSFTKWVAPYCFANPVRSQS